MRQGYDEVVRQCESLAVELLENCRSLSEVQLLLAERSCIRRFFAHTKFLTYPRMFLAVEHGHKKFAGHIYCQQVVRDKFYGKRSWWSDMGLASAIVYFVLQTLLTPIHAVVYEVFHMARYYDHSDHWFPLYARRQKVNLDLPLNRYLSYTGWHFIFILLVAWTAMIPDTTEETPSYIAWSAWYTRDGIQVANSALEHNSLSVII